MWSLSPAASSSDASSSPATSRLACLSSSICVLSSSSSTSVTTLGCSRRRERKREINIKELVQMSDIFAHTCLDARTHAHTQKHTHTHTHTVWPLLDCLFEYSSHANNYTYLHFNLKVPVTVFNALPHYLYDRVESCNAFRSVESNSGQNISRRSNQVDLWVKRRL